MQGPLTIAATAPGATVAWVEQGEQRITPAGLKEHLWAGRPTSLHHLSDLEDHVRDLDARTREAQRSVRIVRIEGPDRLAAAGHRPTRAASEASWNARADAVTEALDTFVVDASKALSV
ncbi:hypothetical protein ABZ916_10000 [Streptomyces sp. NPDC046853]|uniref:hypothetical protein n=1 Tax=Streptomyces sp. NPDC046853 TaxID=3154920 RepID=UPI0033D50ED4